MNWLEGVATVVSTVAAVISVAAAYQTNESEQRLKESLEAISSVAEWSKSLTDSGGNCAAMLSLYSPQEFKDFAQRARFHLRDDQRTYLARCTVAYDKGSFDPENDLVLNEPERNYLANQVLRNLNAYETLAMKWAALGPEAKKTICEQAPIEANTPSRNFRLVAEGTLWWNYPKLVEFMNTCKP